MNPNPPTELEPTSVPGEFQVITASQPTQEPPPRSKLPPLWRNRDFMLLWSGQVISVIGTGATQIVYPLLVLALTNSPAAAGVASGLGFAPYIIFSLPAGALVDRWDRKRVMLYCDLGRALVLITIPIALFFNVLTVWQIFICALVEGSLFVFYNVSEVAALSRVVDKPQLPQAVVQNQIAYSVGSIVAPSIGTVLFQLGRGLPFVFDFVTYMVSVVSLLFIRKEFQAERKQTETHILNEIREGLRWLWHQPLIRFIAFVTGQLNFVGAATTLIVIVLAQNLGATEAEIGFVFSLSAVGGIVGALIGGQIQKRFQFRQVVVSAVCAQALLFPLLLVAPHFYAIAVIMGLTWMTGPIYDVTQFSYRVAQIPDALQGRVNSTFRLIGFGFQPLGAALSGILIQQFGVAVAVAFFTVWFFGIALATLLNPHVRKARQIGQAAANE